MVIPISQMGKLSYNVVKITCPRSHCWHMGELGLEPKQSRFLTLILCFLQARHCSEGLGVWIYSSNPQNAVIITPVLQMRKLEALRGSVACLSESLSLV